MHGVVSARPDRGPEILERALQLAEIGFSLIRLRRVPGDVEGCKRPVGRWKRRQSCAASEEQLTAWFGNGRERNLAIVTGAISGVVVVDADDDDKRAWVESHLPWTPWRVQTGKGVHYYYRHPLTEQIGNRARIAGGALDLRGDGGYCVGPGSLHGSGAVYVAENWPWTTEDAVPTFDLGWIAVDAIASSAESRSTRDANGPEEADVNAPSDAGVSASRPDLSPSTNRFLEVGAPVGERNQRLFQAACDMSGCGWARDEAEPLLRAAALACGLEEAEVDQTVHSAYSQPRTPSRVGGAGFATELWFCQQLAQREPDSFRYVFRWGKWLTWDGVRWNDDDTQAIYRAAKALVPVLIAEARRRLAAAEASGEQARIDRARKQLIKACGFQRRRPLRDAIGLAQSEVTFAATVEQWDAHPWLLNCPNGVVDLRDLSLAPHDPELHLRKVTGADYQPGASAPCWAAFLEQVMPDPEVRSYLQRAIGYSVIGEIAHHVLHVMWGGGANGKSTFLEALAHALGDYASVAPPSLLMAGKSERHPTELADLHGRRLVVASESPEGGRLNENVVKAVTGGDRIKARRMREDFWEFSPSHTIWLATNHKPTVRGNDEGIWRRIRLIPFTVFISADERDPSLPARLRDEAAGILCWVLDGASMYRAEGLAPPEAVCMATQEYRESEDPLGQFLADCVEEAPGGMVRVGDMYHAYQLWAADLGESAQIGQRTLTKRLNGRLDYQNYTPRGFRDVRLIGDDDSDADLVLPPFGTE